MGEESLQGNFQPSQESCTSWLQIAHCSEQTANQNTNIVAEVYKVAHKRRSGLTGFLSSDTLFFLKVKHELHNLKT